MPKDKKKLHTLKRQSKNQKKIKYKKDFGINGIKITMINVFKNANRKNTQHSNKWVM